MLRRVKISAARGAHVPAHVPPPTTRPEAHGNPKKRCEPAAVSGVIVALGFIVSSCATVAVARRALPSAHRVMMMIGLMIVPVLAAMTVLIV